MFDRILGQGPAVDTLTRALGSGRLHHAYRFEGPNGVGKEMAAFALAQALVCEREGPLACGECSACRRAVHLADDEPRVPRHPDVVLVQRGLYPAAALGTSTRETVGIGVEQVRRIVLSRVGFAPHEERALVFIIREAHELTMQAANALLKALEEPRPKVHFVLITSQPNRLLDTIRSRTLAVRFGPLSDAVIERILAERNLPKEIARNAGGSASTALTLADADSARRRTEFVAGALAALSAPDLEAGVVFAGARPDERDALRGELVHLSEHFALEARDSIAGEPARALTAARRYGVVREAVDAVERNAQPALTLEAMVAKLRAI